MNRGNPMSDKPETFEQFWIRYLQAHQNATCRYLHYAASATGLIFLGVLVVTLNPVWLLAGAVCSYGLAWAGHFFAEGNKPLAFTKPVWSLVADYRMFFLAMTGRLRPHLERSAT